MYKIKTMKDYINTSVMNPDCKRAMLFTLAEIEAEIERLKEKILMLGGKA